MNSRPLALIPAVLVLIAACSSGGASSSAPSAETSGAPASAAATRIEVSLADTLRIEPSPMTVPAGVPVTFVVTNTGAIEHEFFIGDEAAQADHEAEMLEMGGMSHDEPAGIALDPSETKELTFTFAEPGETLAGCHVVGHYAAGMIATIVVTE
jgi:uncharacterized cupredoxin-like copper-binding protein